MSALGVDFEHAFQTGAFISVLPVACQSDVFSFGSSRILHGSEQERHASSIGRQLSLGAHACVY